MKYNNQDVTAVKYTGLGIDGKVYTNNPVSKIFNNNGTLMWESEWYTLTVIRTTSGTSKSSKYPACYYGVGNYILDPYLALVMLVNPQYAVHDYSYTPSTGVLSYTLYTDTPSASVGALVYCYKYLKVFEAEPIIFVTISNANKTTKESTIVCTVKNNNTLTTHYTLTIRNENSSIIYTRDLFVQQNNTYSSTITLKASELKITVDFYEIGYKTASSTKIIYPFL